MVFRTLTALANRNQLFRSYMYNQLVGLHQTRHTNKYWKRAWRRVVLKFIDKPVNTRLHGYPATVNCGFSYPLVARLHKQFNNPLVQLVYQVQNQKGRPINLVDVGAAVGDTVFLLSSNLPQAFQSILCIDGDKEFFSYLQQNMKQFSNVECVNALLSDRITEEKSLVRTHAGTASAQGQTNISSVALDELLTQRQFTPDVLKIDTDGFDGKVLAGAKATLSTTKPAVIFEWHPLLLKQTGNDVYQPFEVLVDSGFQTFVFFTKFGAFSHYMFGIEKMELEKLATICFNNKYVNDWHYDVVAVADPSFDIIELAECSFAKTKPSAY